MKRVWKGYEKGMTGVWKGYEQGVQRIWNKYDVWLEYETGQKVIHSVCQTETVANGLHTSISQGLRVSLLVDKAVSSRNGTWATHFTLSARAWPEREYFLETHHLLNCERQPSPSLPLRKKALSSKSQDTSQLKHLLSTCDNPWRWDWIQANSKMISST